jgi:hypothetical protein
MAKLGPLPDVANVCKVRLIGTYNSVRWVNVMHLKFASSTVDATALATIATGVRTAWSTNIAPLCFNATQLQIVEVTDISSRTGAQGVDSSGANGSAIGGGLPNNVAACLTLKVGNRYRGGHPRMYLPGVPAGNTTDGHTWTSTAITAYQNGGRNFRTALNALTAGSTTWSMVAVSYYQTLGGSQAYKVPPGVYVITDVLCHTRMDSMRRRLGKEAT